MALRNALIVLAVIALAGLIFFRWVLAADVSLLSWIRALPELVWGAVVVLLLVFLGWLIFGWEPGKKHNPSY